MIECLSRINKPVIGMAETMALPGSYKYNGESYDQIKSALLSEVEQYAICDFDSVIIQNMNDCPIRKTANPEAVAYMTMLASEVKKAFPKAKVTGEFSIYGHEVRTGKAKVEKWLKSL